MEIVAYFVVAAVLGWGAWRLYHQHLGRFAWTYMAVLAGVLVGMTLFRREPGFSSALGGGVMLLLGLGSVELIGTGFSYWAQGRKIVAQRCWIIGLFLITIACSASLQPPMGIALGTLLFFGGAITLAVYIRRRVARD